MRYRLLTLIPLFSVISSGYTQHTISLGAQIGLGVNIPSANASIFTNGTTYSMRSNVLYSCGILGQYLLHNKFGMETGLAVSYITYAPKDLVPGTFRNFWGWDYTEGITDYQIPIRLVYVMDHPSNPYKRFKVTAGASIDWPLSQHHGKERNSVTSSNLLLGIRMANAKGKLGRTELGIEYQYSFRGNFDYLRQTDKGPEIFSVRYSLLTVNLYYFFLNRES